MREHERRPFRTKPPVVLPSAASLLALLSVLALAACGDFWGNIPPRPAAATDPAVTATPYPSVNDVPARPQLSYPLEQRREIAEGLVADRANARHAGDALRRENDRPVLTDQPLPLPPAAPATRAQAATAGQRGDLALAYVEEALARDADSGTLDDFLERLQQPPIGPGPRSAERAAAAAAARQAQEERAGRPRPQAAPAPAASDAAEPETPLGPEPPSAPERPSPEAVADPALSRLEPAAGGGEASPTRASAAPLDARPAPVPSDTVEAATVAVSAAPHLPLAILFAADDAAIPARDTVKLEALARAKGDAPQLFVVGNGPRPALAMERARSVAALLVGAGIPAERLIIEMGGESDVVVVYEPDGDTG